MQMKRGLVCLLAMLFAELAMAQSASSNVKHSLKVGINDSSKGNVYVQYSKVRGYDNAPLAMDYEHGAVITLTAEPKEGSAFVRWSNGEKGEELKIDLVSDSSVSAEFSSLYTIKFVINKTVNGYTKSEIMTKEVLAGQMPEIPKNFKCPENTLWFDYNCVASEPVGPAEKDKEYVISWSEERRKFSVDAVADTGTHGRVVGSGKYGYESVVELVALANRGYEFDGWSDGVQDFRHVVRVTGDISLTAKFTKVYKISFVRIETKDGYKNTYFSSKEVKYGQMPEIPKNFKCPEDTHWFVYNCSSIEEIVPAKEDKTYTLSWVEKPKTYTVNAVADNEAHGRVTGSGKFGYGSDVELEAKANDGYVFDGWSDGVPEFKRTVHVTSDTSLTAKFTKVYNITFIYQILNGFYHNDSKDFVYDVTSKYIANKTVKKGDVPQLNAADRGNFVCPNSNERFTYSCRWLEEVVPAKSDKLYRFVVKKTPRLYKVDFYYDRDGRRQLLSSDTFVYESTPVVPKGATCPYETAENAYSCSWNRDVSPVMKDEEYIFKVESSAKNYLFNAFARDTSRGSIEIVEENSDPAKLDKTVDAENVLKIYGSYVYGRVIKVIAHPKVGYTILWENGETDSVRTIRVVGDTTLSLEFIPKKNKIKFVYKENGKTMKEVESFVETGNVPESPKNIRCPVIASSIYYADCKWDREFEPATGDDVYYYTMEKAKKLYDVSVTVNGLAHGKVIDYANKVEVGEFESINSALIWTLGQDGNSQSALGRYEFGSKITFTATPEPGYEVKWEDGSTSSERNVVVDGNKTLQLDFVPRRNVVKYIYMDVDDGKIMGESEETLLTGEMPKSPNFYCVYSETPEYYTVCEWDQEFAPVTGDMTYYYRLKRKKRIYSLAVLVDDTTHGVLVGLNESGEYEYGSKVKLSALPAYGYKPIWEDGHENLRREVTVKENMILSVKFERIFAKVTFVYKEGDSTLNVEESVAIGDIPRAPAFGCPSPKSAEYVNDCSWDKELAPVGGNTKYVYEVKQKTAMYHVVPAVNDVAMGSVKIHALDSFYVDKGLDLPYGYVFWVEAMSNDGYEFDRWSDGGLNWLRRMCVEGEMSLYAIFKKSEGVRNEVVLAQSAKDRPSVAANVVEPSDDSKNGKQPLSAAVHLGSGFSVTAAGLDIQVAGAHVGEAYAVFDMQGRVARKGRVENENFNLSMPSAGNYMVRIANRTQRVTLH